MLQDVLLTVFLLGCTIWLVWMVWPILFTAFRTGRLQARGTVYERTQQPFMFRLGIAAWIGMIALMGFTSALALSGVIRQLGK